MLLKIFVFVAVLALTRAQRRYYSLEDMPETNFDCRDKILGGYYADPEANCQMFHVCVKIPGQGVQDFRFLCPNETSFDQENQICADSGDIDCTGSGLYLENFDLYRIGSAPAKRPLPNIGSANKVTAIPLGPSTKSPLLTNNIYEDDDFYLQKSESGDRRLHSKDILRGSSSSNFFNNRNNGKDLEDDDDDSSVRKVENVNNQFKSRPSFPNRPKTQYQSQFRKAEPTTQAPTTKQQIIENRNQITDKKRTKIAVRKLTRKRPEEEIENQPTQQAQQQPGLSTITTQVTQKFGFNDANGRYNTVNRQPTTPSTVATSEVFRQPQQPQQPQQFPQQPQQFPQQPQQFPQQQPQQQRFQNFRRNEQQTTPAFFEPNPTTLPGSKDTTQFSLLRNPIVAAGPNYNQQNRGSTDFQQNRQTTANYPSSASNSNLFSAQNSNFQQQQNRQTTTGIPTNFPQQRPLQQNRQQAPVNNGNLQQQQQQQQQQQNRQQAPVNNGNFQQQQNRQQVPVNNGNFQQQQNRQQVGNNNFQQQQGRQSPQAFSGNFQQQQQQQVNVNSQQNNYNQNRQQVNNGNFQQNRQQQQPTTGVPNRGQNGQQAFNGFNRQQNFNAQQNFNDQQNFNGQSQTRQNVQRQSINRNFDDFEEGDNQEFLKTAPSNNYRPSDLNSFNTNNYKQEPKSNNTRFVQTSTTKYITPTIITTPKTSNFDSSSTIKQNYFPAQQSTTNYYTPTVSTTQRIQPVGSSALPQGSFPSAKPAKPAKDVAYDYAYYDDAGSFSEYDSVDHLGDSDFSRTSQRAKYRLI